MKMLCFASCSFGLEAVVANELTAMGAEPSARDARVYFEADETLLARANIRLSAADRVYIVLDEFTTARSSYITVLCSARAGERYFLRSIFKVLISVRIRPRICIRHPEWTLSGNLLIMYFR